MSQIILPSEAYIAKQASRLTFPGKTPGSQVAVGIDRRLGRFFQYWEDRFDEEPAIDEDRLRQHEIVALMKKWGKPSFKLSRAMDTFMLDLDPGSTRQRLARFHAGPEGAKEFEEWISKQPQETQDAWQEMNEEYGDKLKKARSHYVSDVVQHAEEEAMFAKGEKVPLEDLPQELQDNVEDPPPAVQKLKEELEEEAMMDKQGPPVLPSEVFAQRQRLSWREAASGLYGYTKATQRDVEASIRKLQRQASKLSKFAYRKDAKVVDFLQTHAKRGKSLSARLLIAAMKDLGPKIASEKEASSSKEAKGLYGHPAKTARLGLSVCADFRAAAGEIASDLHTRRTARYAKITGFLGDHSKQARCRYSKLLLSCYPDGPQGKAASQDKEAEDSARERQGRMAGCEKLPEALRENCEKKQEEAQKKATVSETREVVALLNPDGTTAHLIPAEVLARLKAGDFDLEEIEEEHGQVLESEKQAAKDVAETIGKDEVWNSELSKEVQKKADLPEEVKKQAGIPTTVQGWLEWQE